MELDVAVNAPDLWDNPDNARVVLQKKAGLEKTLNELLGMESEYKNLSELYEIAPDDPDVLGAIEKLGGLGGIFGFGAFLHFQFV